MSLAVWRLGPDDATALHALRRDALNAHPLAFGAAPEDDRMRELAAVAESIGPPQRRAIYGAFDGERLVGMGGVLREPRVKSRHLAIIWGMYVAPPARGRGAGRLLLDALVAHARTWPGVVMVELSVTEAAPEALSLYRAAGFRAWGTEPRSLHWQGCYVDQTFLTLDLDRD